MEGTDELHQKDDTQRIRSMMQENSSDPTIPSLRGIDALKVKGAISEVNDIICNIKVKDLDELKNLLRTGTRLVCEKIGVFSNKKDFKEPFWERRIKDNIARLRKDLSQFESSFKGEWKNIKHRRKDELRRKYSIQAKGFKTVIEELKQRITAKSGKLKHYKTRVTQYRQTVSPQSESII